MKIKTTVHVYYSKFCNEYKGGFQVLCFKSPDDDYRVWVSEQEVEIEVPENFDPRQSEIAALEARKTKAMADYQKSVTEINDRISKLQALEYTA
jgi:hypothetical protein